MKFLVEYLEHFRITCKVCNSDNLKVYTTRDGEQLIFECDRCDELEEVENSESYRK